MKKLYYIILSAVSIVSVYAVYTTFVYASDTGFVAAGTGADDNTVGTHVWNSLTSITVSDDIRSSAGVGGGGCGSPVVNSVKVVKAGVVGGSDKSTSQAVSSSDATITFGTSADLWGNTLTSTDVNASNFGFAFSGAAGAQLTDYLTATNFGFSIPAGATINGIEATTEVRCVTSTYGMDYMSMRVTYTPSDAASGASVVVIKNPTVIKSATIIK